jgi:hypothetical protein
MERAITTMPAVEMEAAMSPVGLHTTKGDLDEAPGLANA